ncbi:EAL domain-containing protein [Mobilitalea sibirica]|uniref:EAL domain-containing protein n=1 Tax=Mobilitalea sibirica TaxID=1462919 RepID=A0A8J7H119_9FIRM|nr:GGDEF domain-containing phosphodiesterase [Mobilitalea sibirica]MBH1939974.1 EAL domain-containing protein [Mobilitalea sibirica]
MKKSKQEQSVMNEMTYNRKIKYYHWIGLVLSSIIYLWFINLIVYFSSPELAYWVHIGDSIISKTSIVGIIAQTQVVLIILMVLNPIKISNMVAIILNMILASGAIYATFIKGNMDALPGVVIPVSTIIMVIIISRYGNNLNKQIKKVIHFNQIIKKNEEMLHNMAYYDSLTQLPNRTMMLEKMGSLTDPYAKENNSFIFVFIDLDNFKKINDSMGHSVGDEILKQISMRWKESVHAQDLLGRLGGDEFALIICRDLTQTELLEYVESFRFVLSKAFTIEHKDFYINASFGITRYPEDGSNTTELLKNADIALYNAKNAGKNEIQFFNKEMQKDVLKRIQLENGLFTAVRNNELYMVFQPQYTSDSKKLRGYEALARWEYSELGFISPGQFIPIAEETGIIIEMGKWIFRTVLEKFMEFQKRFDKKPMVSINISVVQMIEPNFVTMVKEILNETGFDSRYLELEITESVFISYPDHIINVIKQLREFGIRIAIDDFGTGYASLSYLHLLPINVLKIDKAFIDLITTQKAISQIVSNIINLSHQLGIEVVAEGVEDEEQLNALIQFNCDYIQGYLFSKPISEEQLFQMHD